MSSSTLFAGLIWGSVGLGYVIYGKKQGAGIPMISGFVLMAISYVIASALWMSVAAVAIIVAAWWLRKYL